MMLASVDMPAVAISRDDGETVPPSARDSVVRRLRAERFGPERAGPHRLLGKVASVPFHGLLAVTEGFSHVLVADAVSARDEAGNHVRARRPAAPRRLFPTVETSTDHSGWVLVFYDRQRCELGEGGAGVEAAVSGVPERPD